VIAYIILITGIYKYLLKLDIKEFKNLKIERDKDKDRSKL